MRNGSAALVPLLIAVMALFWFIMFLGGSDDNLHTINSVSKLQKVQEKLLISSVKQRYKIEAEAEENNTTILQEQINQSVDAYIEYIMIENKIENGGV